MKIRKDNRAGRDNLSKLLQRFDGLENNNPPTNPIDQRKSGILYTSDWIDKESYPDPTYPFENCYEESILAIDKLQREGEWVYDIELIFRNVPNPNYSDNIINVNDFFTIKKVLAEPTGCEESDECIEFQSVIVKETYAAGKTPVFTSNGEDGCVFYISDTVFISEALGEEIEMSGIYNNPLTPPPLTVSLTLDDILDLPGPYYLDSVIGYTSIFGLGYFIVKLVNADGNEVCLKREYIGLDVPLEQTLTFNFKEINVPSDYNIYVGDLVNITAECAGELPSEIYVGSLEPSQSIPEHTNVHLVDSNGDPVFIDCNGTLCITRNSCVTCYEVQAIPEICRPKRMHEIANFGFLTGTPGDVTFFAAYDTGDFTQFQGYEISWFWFNTVAPGQGPFFISSTIGTGTFGGQPVWVFNVSDINGNLISYDGFAYYDQVSEYCIRKPFEFNSDLVLSGGDIYSLYLGELIDTSGYTATQNLDLSWTIYDELNNPVYIPAEGGNICIYTGPAIVNPINYVYNNDVRGYVKDIKIKNVNVVINHKHVTYSLTCVITEGEPYLVSIGDRYIWSRDEFVDDETFTRIPPSNLESLRITNVDSLLSWTDSTDSANSFILRIRKNGSNLPSDIYYIDNIVLSPVINYRTGNRNATEGSVYEYTFDFSTLGLMPGEWRWSLCSVYDDLRKDFSMWSDESLLIIK